MTQPLKCGVELELTMSWIKWHLLSRPQFGHLLSGGDSDFAHECEWGQERNSGPGTQ